MKKPIEYSYNLIYRGDSIRKVPQNLVSVKDPADKCLKCKSELFSGSTTVPTSPDKGVLINGGYCKKCDILYIEHNITCLIRILNNEYAKGFTLNGIMINEYSKELTRREIENERKAIQEKRELIQERKKTHEEWRAKDIEYLSGIENAVMRIIIRFEDGEKRKYVIVNKKADDYSERGIIIYSCKLGRELLSAAFAEERKRHGEINGRKYKVIDVVEKEPDLKSRFISDDCYIQEGGGYYKPQYQTRRYETVDYLMYSLKTNCYEIIHATYDKKEKSCFFDITLYRKFVREYGKQREYVDFYRSAKRPRGAFADWNTESFLHQYGYNVSQNSNLSESFRHELLAEIVDLEYMSIGKIVKYLEFFIRTKSSNIRNINAIAKWEDDLEFIRNYKVNPSRFIIGAKTV